MLIYWRVNHAFLGIPINMPHEHGAPAMNDHWLLPIPAGGEHAESPETTEGAASVLLRDVVNPCFFNGLNHGKWDVHQTQSWLNEI